MSNDRRPIITAAPILETDIFSLFIFTTNIERRKNATVSIHTCSCMESIRPQHVIK